MLSTPQIAATLRAETLIANQLEEVGRFNKTLFAVGSCRPDSHVVSSGVATVDELRWYVDHGATGVLCGRFIAAAAAMRGGYATHLVTHQSSAEQLLASGG